MLGRDPYSVDRVDIALEMEQCSEQAVYASTAHPVHVIAMLRTRDTLNALKLTIS